ncbi:MAG TPA: carboxymuconolactone decarboxylase family protein [Phycisphaerae bacterium]|nr:carboxymuconolactone decarboxylase family protein [Phycisphaerae bacterium]
MAWIKTVADHEATGPLKALFEAASKRAGRVFNIVRVMSPNPQTLRASMGFYQATMFGDSPLSRAQRELLATVVSKANRCDY